MSEYEFSLTVGVGSSDEKCLDLSGVVDFAKVSSNRSDRKRKFEKKFFEACIVLLIIERAKSELKENSNSRVHFNVKNRDGSFEESQFIKEKNVSRALKRAMSYAKSSWAKLHMSRQDDYYFYGVDCGWTALVPCTIASIGFSAVVTFCGISSLIAGYPDCFVTGISLLAAAIISIVVSCSIVSKNESLRIETIFNRNPGMLDYKNKYTLLEGKNTDAVGENGAKL